MMGRNNEQCSSQDSRNKGSEGREMELEEQVAKKGLMSSIETAPLEKGGSVSVSSSSPRAGPPCRREAGDAGAGVGER